MYQTRSPEWLKAWTLCMEQWFKCCFIYGCRDWSSPKQKILRHQMLWQCKISPTLETRRLFPSWQRQSRCLGTHGTCWHVPLEMQDIGSKASPLHFLGKPQKNQIVFPWYWYINGMTDQIQLILHQYCFQDGWRKYNWFNFLGQFPSNLASNIQNVINQLVCVIMRIDKGGEWIVPLSFMLAGTILMAMAIIADATCIGNGFVHPSRYHSKRGLDLRDKIL